MKGRVTDFIPERCNKGYKTRDIDLRKPRWSHDHAVIEWPRSGNKWALTVKGVADGFDSIGRHDRWILIFEETGYPPMWYPTFELKGTKFIRHSRPRVGQILTMDSRGIKRFENPIIRHMIFELQGH